MSAQDRLNIFAKLVGFQKPIFNNFEDAEAFVELTKENSVMSQFKVFYEFINKKVHVKIDTDENNSNTLTWNNLSKYTVNNRGIVD